MSASAPLPAPLVLDTPAGPAHAHGFPASTPIGQVVLTHGANGTLTTADLLALSSALPEAGWSVTLIRQAFAVAGRRTPPRAPEQDEAWIAAVAALGAGPGPVVLGGRSNGARVAARTAGTTHPAGVLALAYPLHPPGKPDRSRANELAVAYDAELPVLVVQGRTDPFGRPAEVRAAVAQPETVIEAAGGHSFGKDPADVVDAVVAWLGRFWESRSP